MIVTNFYYNSRVFHIEKTGPRTTIDIIQGTDGDVTGIRTDDYFTVPLTP